MASTEYCKGSNALDAKPNNGLPNNTFVAFNGKIITRELGCKIMRNIENKRGKRAWIALFKSLPGGGLPGGGLINKVKYAINFFARLKKEYLGQFSMLGLRKKDSYLHALTMSLFILEGSSKCEALKKGIKKELMIDLKRKTKGVDYENASAILYDMVNTGAQCGFNTGKALTGRALQIQLKKLAGSMHDVKNNIIGATTFFRFLKDRCAK